jgi:GNAT superfamily N-acetyltransferase
VGIDIVPAMSTDQITTARRLFREYEASLRIDLSFQDFAREVAELPGAYAPPAGRLLLATEGFEPTGCVALRPLGGDLCEMKRLYVRPAARGKRVGRLLAETVIREARLIGYARMRLDTLPFMKEATAIYRALGFVEIAPYYDNPVAGSLCMERALA